MNAEQEPEFLKITTDFADFAKFPAAVLVTRLAMAFNDIACAVRLLDPSRVTDSANVSDSATVLYATRILFGHVSEAITLVESVQGTKDLQPHIVNLSAPGKAAYDELRSMTKGGSQEQLYRDRIRAVRDKTAFHWDKDYVRDAIRSMAGEDRKEMVAMIVTESAINSRFLFADVVMERVIGELVWKVDPKATSDADSELYALFDWSMVRVKMFLDLASDLCSSVLLSIGDEQPVAQ